MATPRQSIGRAGSGPFAGLGRIGAGGTGGWSTSAVVRKLGDVAFFAFLQVSAMARLNASVDAIREDSLLLAGAHASTGVMLLAMAVLFLVRRPVVGQRASWSGIVAALVGSWAVVPLAWLPVNWDASGVLAFSLIANAIGAAGVCVALRSLGRSFAVLPEARRLVTSGAYRWVRHPIYTLHIVALVGTMLPRIGLPALAFLVVGIAGECVRARNEERALRRAFPEYEAYQRRTKRFIPWVY